MTIVKQKSDKYIEQQINSDHMTNNINIAHIEMEITSKCNMNCLHCRSPYKDWKELSSKQVEKVLDLVSEINKNKRNGYYVVLEGGEPLMHSDIFSILKILKKNEKNGCNKIIIITNGSLVDKKFLHSVKTLKLKSFSIIFSLDHYIGSKHDSFRSYKGSYRKIMESIKLIKEFKIDNLRVGIKTTVSPESFPFIDKMRQLVEKLGCDTWLVTDVQPFGKALDNNKLLFLKKDKIKFIEKIYSLIKLSKNLEIKMFEPLATLIVEKQDKKKYYSSFGCFPCCAGVNYVSVKPNGDITPCELMNLPIININDDDPKILAKNYINSPIIKNLSQKNLFGKGKSCDNNKICYGCRARAWSVNKDYLAEDPDCWL